MIQANCRDRLTGDDFAFVIKTLAHSPEASVSLVELLTDAESRDSVLDHDQLASAIVSQSGQLSISAQLYFYVLSRRVLRQAGLEERGLADYVASLLEQFSRTSRLSAPGQEAAHGVTYLCDLLSALQTADSSRAFLLRTHAGDYALFLTGIFHEAVERRSRRGAPGASYYQDVGRSSYRLAAQHTVARRCGLTPIYEQLADDFPRVRGALNELSDCLLNLDDDAHLPPGLALQN